MALLALQDAAAPAAGLTFQAANAGGDTIPQGLVCGGWQSAVVLVVRNADVAAKTVTVAGMPACVIAAGGAAVIPVLGPTTIDAGVPIVRAIAYSAVTSVTVAAARLYRP